MNKIKILFNIIGICCVSIIVFGVGSVILNMTLAPDIPTDINERIRLSPILCSLIGVGSFIILYNKNGVIRRS